MSRFKQYPAVYDPKEYVRHLALATRPAIGGNLGLDVVKDPYMPWLVTINIVRAKSAWKSDDVVIGSVNVPKDAIYHLAELLKSDELLGN